MSRRVTMADVAREAGVSLMTVSRVVNHKDGISAETRKRIQAIIDRLGYRPSNIARGLVTKRTGTLGLVVPDIANPFFSEVGRGAEDVAYAEGYNIFLCNTGEDHEREITVLQSLEEKRVDGVVLCSSRLDEADLNAALAYHPVVILINRELSAEVDGSLVIADRRGGEMATRHLIERGHRRIGFLAGPRNSYSGQQRALGYRDALANAGIPYDPDLTWPCAPKVESGKAAALELLQTNPDVSALFCYNDLVAVGALQASMELGRHVPDDLAIVGFDDIPLAVLVTPPLTTCHVPRYELGRRAMWMLLDQIRLDGAQNASPEQAFIQPELVIRASAP